MKNKIIRYLGAVGMTFSLPFFFLSCGGNAPQPPSPFIIVDTYYKSPTGIDLLNPSVVNSFKKTRFKCC
jgi:hypothetical protein